MVAGYAVRYSSVCHLVFRTWYMVWYSVLCIVWYSIPVKYGTWYGILQHTLTVSKLENPFLGTLLEISIGRGFGALKGASHRNSVKFPGEGAFPNRNVMVGFFFNPPAEWVINHGLSRIGSPPSGRIVSRDLNPSVTIDHLLTRLDPTRSDSTRSDPTRSDPTQPEP